MKKTENKLEVVKPFDDSVFESHAGKVGGKKNLRLVSIKLPEDELEYVYLIKKPSRATIQALGEAGKKKDQDKAQKLLLGCVLEGDKEAYDYDGSIYVALLDKISKIAEQTKSDVKKI